MLGSRPTSGEQSPTGHPRCERGKWGIVFFMSTKIGRVRSSPALQRGLGATAARDARPGTTVSRRTGDKAIVGRLGRADSTLGVYHLASRMSRARARSNRRAQDPCRRKRPAQGSLWPVQRVQRSKLGGTSSQSAVAARYSMMVSCRRSAARSFAVRSPLSRSDEHLVPFLSAPSGARQRQGDGGRRRQVCGEWVSAGQGPRLCARQIAVAMGWAM
jgi:hypothetical protein